MWLFVVRKVSRTASAQARTAEQLQRPPRYGETLVDPFRDHLRHRQGTCAHLTALAERVGEFAGPAAARSKDTYLRSRYRRIAPRGKRRALVAVGHSILTAV